MNEKQQAYQDRMEAELKQWSARIVELRAKVQKAQADAKVRYHEQLERLKAQEATARNKLDELKKSGADAWQPLKSGVDAAVKELRETIARS